jgi:FixJ family two-component response regulator
LISEPTIFVIDTDAQFSQSTSELAASLGLKSEQFGSADEFLHHFNLTRPGCLVLELLPGTSGLDLQQALGREPLSPPLIFVTSSGNVEMAVRALRSGAVNLFEKKSFSRNELCESIQIAITLDGQNRMAHELRQIRLGKLAELSEAERHVFDLLLSGKTNMQIAIERGSSRRGVEAQRGRLMAKLGIRNIPDLMRFAIEAGVYRSPIHRP